MPEPGEYVLTNIGFSTREKPFIALQNKESFYDLMPLDTTLTLRFDTTQRYCIGWRDITAGERHVCPGKNKVEGKYEECAACQQRTGFNPAFYHADSVSKQQEARNQEPHFLYLAHFGPGVIKVGISYAARNRSRLLEQGARSALILDTFPSALIARQYEAKIAALPNISETVQLRKKLATLSKDYDQVAAKQELEAIRTFIEQNLSTSFAKNDVLSMDRSYFPTGTPNLSDTHETTEQGIISGSPIGMLGSLLFCLQKERLMVLSLKKYAGYKVRLSYTETLVDLPIEQMSLFEN